MIAVNNEEGDPWEHAGLTSGGEAILVVHGSLFSPFPSKVRRGGNEERRMLLHQSSAENHWVEMVPACNICRKKCNAMLCLVNANIEELKRKQIILQNLLNQKLKW